VWDGIENSGRWGIITPSSGKAVICQFTKILSRLVSDWWGVQVLDGSCLFKCRHIGEAELRAES